MCYSDVPLLAPPKECKNNKFLGHILGKDIYYCLTFKYPILIVGSKRPYEFYSSLDFASEEFIERTLGHLDTQRQFELLLKREVLLRASTRGYRLFPIIDRDVGEPKFEHDCSQCHYMGHVLQYDLYCHLGKYENGNIILRYGSDCHEYSSGEDFAMEWFLNSILSQESDVKNIIYLLIKREAMLRAIARGYVPPSFDRLKRV